ncbi:MAG: GNAT family N-acetyltransferase [Candidatus Altiarchaeia archaeon]
MDGRIDIRLVRKWPSREIIALYDAGCWWDDADSGSIQKIISGSFAFAVAVDEKTGKAIGMGRALSDGASDAYLQDVIVLPAYRKQDIGKKIVAALVEYCLAKKVTWISLIAEPGSEKFYSGLGFKDMEGHTPMKYKGGMK